MPTPRKSSSKKSQKSQKVAPVKAAPIAELERPLPEGKMAIVFRDRVCVIGTALYGNRRLALRIVDFYKDESLLMATTNFATAEEYVQPHEFLVLNDGEEKGILDVLKVVEIVVPTGRTLITPAGRTAHICTRGSGYRGEH